MKTVIEMAREAGGVIWSDKSASMHRTELERFAELIRADEREACAKVCENITPDHPQECAAAIRARGEASLRSTT